MSLKNPTEEEIDLIRAYWPESKGDPMGNQKITAGDPMGNPKITASYTPRFLGLMHDVYPDEIRANRECRLQLESLMDFVQGSNARADYKQCLRFALDQAKHAGLLDLVRFWVGVVEAVLKDKGNL